MSRARVPFVERGGRWIKGQERNESFDRPTMMSGEKRRNGREKRDGWMGVGGGGGATTSRSADDGRKCKGFGWV
jgi:hypothetical protein